METKQLFAKSFEKTQYILVHLIKNTFFLSQSFILCRISLIYIEYRFIPLCWYKKINNVFSNVLAGSKNVEEISL